MSEKKIAFKPKIDTAPKTGIDNKKDIFAASTLLKFNNLAALIVIPDLLTPGISERIWNNPIIIAVLYVKFFLMSFSRPNLSLINSKIPNKIVVQAIISMFLISSINPNFTKK